MNIILSMHQKRQNVKIFDWISGINLFFRRQVVSGEDTYNHLIKSISID